MFVICVHNPDFYERKTKTIKLRIESKTKKKKKEANKKKSSSIKLVSYIFLAGLVVAPFTPLNMKMEAEIIMNFFMATLIPIRAHVMSSYESGFSMLTQIIVELKSVFFVLLFEQLFFIKDNANNVIITRSRRNFWNFRYFRF